MASKSRLGRGLGALFPSLPGEETKPQAEEAKPKVEETKPKIDAATVEKVTQAVHETAQAAKAEQKAQAAKGEHRKPAKQNASVKSTAENSGSEPAIPVSPLDSTIPSMGVMSRNAETVSKLSAPMTLQPEAAEHRPISAQSQKNSNAAPNPSTRSKRAAMPAIGDMSHPSDMFFDSTHAANTRAAEKLTQARATANATANTTAAIPNLRPVEGGYLAELDISQIGPNLYQPRSVFNDTELQELAASIQEVGILQPIVVRKRPADQKPEDQPALLNNDPTFANRLDSEYELIMGERRWRASQLAGLTTIPAIVKTTADDYMLRDALLENLHRVALNPLEEAAAYQQMIDEFGLTQMQLAQSVSKSRPQIANTLRLMNLPASVQKRLSAGQISAGHARALLGLPDTEQMEQLAQRIVDEGLSVRSVEEIVSMQAANHPKKPKANKHNPWAGSSIQTSLEERFATKVSIKGSENHGRIEIVFSSPEEMERIVNLLQN